MSVIFFWGLNHMLKFYPQLLRIIKVTEFSIYLRSRHKKVTRHPEKKIADKELDQSILILHRYTRYRQTVQTVSYQACPGHIL